MSASTLLLALGRRGVRLSVVDGRLRVEAPAGVLTAADRAALVEHKSDLLRILVGDRWDASAARAEIRAVWNTLALGYARHAFDMTAPAWVAASEAVNAAYRAQVRTALDAVLRHLQRLAAPCWFDRPPWNGQIDQATFDAVIDAYRERYGYYSPSLPLQEPELLAAWSRPGQ